MGREMGALFRILRYTSLANGGAPATNAGASPMEEARTNQVTNRLAPGWERARSKPTPAPVSLFL